MIDGLDYNNVLNVIEYLNVVDSGRLATTAKRYFYLVQEYRRLRGPEVVTVSSYDCTTFEQRPAAVVASEPISKLQKAPNLVLAFNTTRSTLDEELPKRLPPDTVVLGACAHSIQVNLGAYNVESKSNASVMYASLPEADILPFSFEMGYHESELEVFLARLECNEHPDDHWKAVIVYASGSGAALAESFVSKVQAKLPNAAIVGGICGQGYVSKPKKNKSDLQRMTIRQLVSLLRQLGGPPDFNAVEKSDLVDHVWNLQSRSNSNISLYHAEDAVFGVVLGGNVPVRSVVSRGVKSMTHGTPQPTSPYVVKKVTLTRPEDPDFLFRGNDLQPIHMIQEITNTDTGTTITAMDLMTQAVDDAEFIGIKRPQDDGFELHMISPYCQATNSFLIMTDGSEAQQQSLDGAEIDFFSLSGEACCQDMDHTMNMLREQTRGEEILGAVMYSCSGRGPRPGGLIPEHMADANRFAKVFPDVPCLGYYAGGEIGPLALAGNQKVFRTGKATVQGFTAVFCLFIVPVVKSRDYRLDDSPDAVRHFVQSRLST